MLAALAQRVARLPSTAFFAGQQPPSDDDVTGLLRESNVSAACPGAARAIAPTSTPMDTTAPLATTASLLPRSFIPASALQTFAQSDTAIENPQCGRWRSRGAGSAFHGKKQLFQGKSTTRKPSQCGTMDIDFERNNPPDVGRLRALLTLGDLELDPLVLVERPVAAGGDRRVVREHVGAAVVGRDEAEALVRVEPLDRTDSHVFSFARLCRATPCGPAVSRQSPSSGKTGKTKGAWARLTIRRRQSVRGCQDCNGRILACPAPARMRDWRHGGVRSGQRFGVHPAHRADLALLPFRWPGWPVGEHLRLPGRAALRPCRHGGPAAAAEGAGAGPAGRPAGRRGAGGDRRGAPLTAAEPAGRRGPTGGRAGRRGRAAGPGPPADPAIPDRRAAAAGQQAAPGRDQAAAPRSWRLRARSARQETSISYDIRARQCLTMSGLRLWVVTGISVAVVLAGSASAHAAPGGDRERSMTVMTPATALAARTDRRPVAGGLYDRDVQKTFISWGGVHEDNYVQAYDHRTGTWSKPVWVGSGEDDSHNYPTMVQAPDGHLLVFHNLHNTELRMDRSPLPHSIEGTWTEQVIAEGAGATYPMPFVTESGAVFVFIRETVHDLNKKAPVDWRPMKYVRSLDSGLTWSNTAQLTGDPYAISPVDRPDNMNEIYIGQLRYVPGRWGRPDRVLIVYTLAGGGFEGHLHDRYHKNIYYTYFTPGDLHFHSADGIDLGTRVDDAEQE